ncbi:MAG TPA: RNA polymerase sigma factor [Candidatus Brocadiia bacterium]|nr:RNA polymerase sigma factor [Candidatus Brocadiia bacterium]
MNAVCLEPSLPAPCFAGRLCALYWAGMAEPDERDDLVDQHDARLAAAGNREAFERLVKRHQGWVGRQMWRFSRDRGEQEALAQDVFVNAWLSLGSYRGDGPFEHWLSKIAVRTGYAFWRRARQRAETRPLDEAKLAPAPEQASPAEAAEVVHGLLARLGPRDRVVVTLLNLEGRGVAEAAELLGWSRSLVKAQAWRARRKMRRMLEQAGLA